MTFFVSNIEWRFVVDHSHWRALGSLNWAKRTDGGQNHQGLASTHFFVLVTKSVVVAVVVEKTLSVVVTVAL
jgi:hypothetical protein